jgi:RIO kinase 2
MRVWDCAQEYAFMAALGQRGLPVPRAVDHNRHAVLMSLVDAYPLTQVGPGSGFRVLV